MNWNNDWFIHKNLREALIVLVIGFTSFLTLFPIVVNNIDSLLSEYVSSPNYSCSSTLFFTLYFGLPCIAFIYWIKYQKNTTTTFKHTSINKNKITAFLLLLLLSLLIFMLFGANNKTSQISIACLIILYLLTLLALTFYMLIVIKEEKPSKHKKQARRAYNLALEQSIGINAVSLLLIIGLSYDLTKEYPRSSDENKSYNSIINQFGLLKHEYKSIDNSLKNLTNQY